VTADYEVAIIGGGPNGLTAAVYLARSGASVAVLERRFERGGTMASDDYSTPFTYNQAQAALAVGADNPVVTELGLADWGAAFIEPDVAAEVITRRGEHPVGRGGTGLGRTAAAMFASISQACIPALYRPPAPEQSLTAGAVRQGALSPAQSLDLRPHPLCADTRTPVPGFYLGGGGVHPGVPGTLAAGRLAAQAMMADQRLTSAAAGP
jgi:phytoene dehydrogenase-like protein